MCIAAPGRVVKLHGKQADVDYGEGIIRTVVVANHTILVGDCVLVQMGIVVNVLSGQEAESIADSWKERFPQASTTK